MTFVLRLILRHQSTSSSLLHPLLRSPPSITQPLPSLLMRKVVGWKCNALSAASARNSAEIVWEGQQTWCSPTWLWHGATEEWNSAEREGCKNPHSPCYPWPGVSAQPKPWQRFTLMRDFFTAIAAVNQTGQGEMAARHSRNATLKGAWGGGGSDRMHRENKQSWTTLNSYRRAPNEICDSEIPGHIFLNTLI